MTEADSAVAMPKHYATGRYWKQRRDMMYYQYIRRIMKDISGPGDSIIDVGSGNSPYMEWFSWASRRVSIDIRAPYASATVEGITADILSFECAEMFDLCLCLQVLEHIDDPGPFAQRLFELGRVVLISVPYRWPKGRVKWHPQDPVDQDMLAAWTGREPDYSIVVTEPLKRACHQRLVALYDPQGVNKRIQRYRQRTGRAPAHV